MVSDCGQNNSSDRGHCHSFERLPELRRHLLVDVTYFQGMEVRQGLEAIRKDGEDRIHPVACDSDRNYTVDHEI